MNDIRILLDRQAAWQSNRAALSWPEKIRMAEAVREWAAQVSRARRSKTAPKEGSKAEDISQPKPEEPSPNA